MSSIPEALFPPTVQYGEGLLATVTGQMPIKVSRINSFLQAPQAEVPSGLECQFRAIGIFNLQIKGLLPLESVTGQMHEKR